MKENSRNPKISGVFSCYTKKTASTAAGSQKLYPADLEKLQNGLSLDENKEIQMANDLKAPMNIKASYIMQEKETNQQSSTGQREVKSADLKT